MGIFDGSSICSSLKFISAVIVLSGVTQRSPNLDFRSHWTHHPVGGPCYWLQQLPVVPEVAIYPQSMEHVLLMLQKLQPPWQLQALQWLALVVSRGFLRESHNCLYCLRQAARNTKKATYISFFYLSRIPMKDCTFKSKGNNYIFLTCT